MPMLRNIKITTTVTTRLEVSGSTSDASRHPIDTTVSRTISTDRHAVIAVLPEDLGAHFDHAINLVTDQIEPAYEQQVTGDV
jgi:hypothetical protein